MILKFTLRNLVKRPFLNLVKILGLSFAITGFIVITLFLKNELSFDNFHSKSERIYRYTFTNNNFFGGKHFARVYNVSYIPEMADYFPEIKTFVRLAPLGEGFIKYEERYIKINQAFACDSTFFNVFDCELIIGNSENILNTLGSLIISESLANKIFGNKNPVGETLNIPVGQYTGESTEYTINGVMKDFPENSHFHPDFITSPIDESIFNGWGWVYFLLEKNANPENIENGYKKFIASILNEEENDIEMVGHLQNINNIHLHSNKLREIEPNGNLNVVYTLSVAAFLLLFIALINYANLNIGMAGFSDKFIFINKLSGSSNRITIKNYLSGGIIVILTTIICSGILLAIADSIIQNHFGLPLFKGNILLIIFMEIVFAVLCLLASLAPIYKTILNRVNSNLDLQNVIIKRKGISKGLIVLQYTVTIALIIAVFVIELQTNYALKSGMGKNTGEIICFENVHTNVQADFQVFKEELLKFGSIENVSAMFEPPGGEANDMFPFEMEGYIPANEDQENDFIGVFPCDNSFINLFNLKLLSGKNFSENAEDNEGSGEYIINESAMKRLGYSNPGEIIGKQFKLLFFNESVQIPGGKIIGVVEDFHYSSLKKEIEPKVFFKRKDHWIGNFIVSFKHNRKIEALEAVKLTWNKLFPYYPFEYGYLDSMYKNVYRAEILQSRLISIFTLISLFICSMGLLGMSLLVIQKRTKEIGIRKVNGAKESQIVFMLNWNLLKWVFLSFILSIPLAYYAMGKWLENFAYKISLSWWIFALAGILAILISFITVTIISWNAARSNPVKALRYE